MKKIVLLLFSVLLMPVYARAEQPQREAGAIILKDIDRTTVFSSFTYTTVEHEKIQILNKRGVNGYCEVVLPYSTEYQRIEILDATTTEADGKILKPGKKAINDVTPPFIVSAPIYSDIKYRTITMPGCVPGSTIEYTVRITTIKPYMDDNFFDSDRLQTSDPIALSEYEISVPKNMKFNYRQYHFTDTASIVEHGDRLVYTWKLTNIPQIIPEQNMPPMGDVANRVAVSTVPSWDALAQWYWGLAGTQYATDKSINKTIEDLIKGRTTRDEKIRAIFNYVALNIRYVGIEFGIEGYKPHKAIDIFKNKYGDCKDHATLLIAMLKHIGVTAYPVLVDTAGIAKMDPTLPSPGQFDHEIVAIPGDHGFWFLDSTSDVTGYKDLPPMDQGRDVVVIQPDKAIIVKTPVFKADVNSIVDTRSVDLRSDGSLAISMDITFNGVYSMYEKAMLRGMKPVQRKSYIEGTANAVCPGAAVSTYSISDIYSLNIPVGINIRFTCQDYVIKAGDLLIVQVPLMSMENLSQIVARDTRTYPLVIGYNFEKKNVVTFNIPEGYKIRYMPGNTTSANTFGSFSVVYKRLERHLSYTGTMLSDAYTVQPQDYALIKQLFNSAVITGKKQVVVFEKLRFTRHAIHHRRRK